MHHPSGTGPVVDIVLLAKRRYRNTFAWVAGVYEAAVANIHSYMRDTVAIGVAEEDQIACFKVAFVNRLAGVVLLFCSSWQIDSSGLTKNVSRETGAVKSRPRSSAHYIACTLEGFGRTDDVSAA